MKNKVIQKLIDDLFVEMAKLPESKARTKAVVNLNSLVQNLKEADSDDKHNPPGKVVVRNQKGRVIGLQG